MKRPDRSGDRSPSEPPQPDPSRLTFGFFAAPLVPAMLIAAMFIGEPDLPVGFPLLVIFFVGLFTYPALLVALPAYLLLRRRMAIGPVACAIAGGLTGAVYWLALCLGVGSIPGVLPSILLGVGLMFVLGVLAGISFWLLVFWRDPRFARTPAESPEVRPLA